MKTKGVAYYKKQADKYFSQYIRQRDADRHGMVKCITCPAAKPWKEMQAGHFVKRSVSMLRYSDENVNAQCMQCNVYKYGEQYKYAQEVDLKFGQGTADRLYAQRHTSHKFTIQELQDIIEEAKANVQDY